MELGYARVSTGKQDLDRQIDALTTAGIDPARIYLDKKSGATTNRPGLQTLLDYARGGDVIVVHTLDRLGRTVRDTLNLIHDLHERGVGVRNLADPIRIDSSNPDDPMAQLAVVLLALFGQMERTYAIERAAHARAVATTQGRQVGRPSVVTDASLALAVQLREHGATMSEIAAKTGLTRSTLYRHLPKRPVEQVTAADPGNEGTEGGEPNSAATDSPAEDHTRDPLVCPSCGYRPARRRDLIPHHHDLATIWLHLEDGQVRERRHCVRCQPHDQVTSINCSVCGDGVLVTGATDDVPPEPVLDWLNRHHWETQPELVCGNHL